MTSAPLKEVLSGPDEFYTTSFIEWAVSPTQGRRVAGLSGRTPNFRSPLGLGIAITVRPVLVLGSVPDGSVNSERSTLLGEASDADERGQLQVLKAATEPNAGLYCSVLAFMVAAKERYQVQVRTEDIARSLTEAGFETATLTPVLEQLKDWGALTWTQDTSRVARLEDFHRRRELWQLTAAGHVAHDSSCESSGLPSRPGRSNERSSGDIRENLDSLAAAVDSGDATVTYLRLRDLDSALRDLAGDVGTSTPPWRSSGASTSWRLSASLPTSTC